jgi:uncharacterized membrane protein
MAASAPAATVALAVSYPIVSHFASTLHLPALGLSWLCLALIVGFAFGTRSPVVLALGLLCLGGALLGHLSGSAELFLRMPPVIIFAGLTWLFGRSLLPGRTPLVVRVGERIRGELPEPVARYGRGLTAVWTLLFALMTLESVLLGLFASPFWWSLFTNFVNYGLIVLLFVAEYPIRRAVLGDLERTPFVDSLRGSLRLDLL